MKEKLRTVITTDGEVDDMNSFMRYLLYSNEIDTAGIILTSSVFHYAGNGKDIKPFRWTGEDWIPDYINRYGKFYPNLIKHAEGYPTPEYLQSIYRIGNISEPGEMDEVTEGSKFLEELFLDDDDRTLYVQTWGGTNTTARALKSIAEKYKNTEQWSEVKDKIEKKVVIYVILDQDITYSDYIAKEWNIKVIKDEFNFWYFAYSWREANKQLTTHLSAEWQVANILEQKNLLIKDYALIADGRIIPGEKENEQRGPLEYLVNNPEQRQYEFISEGDSPSYFYLFNNGLKNAINPTYGGWGGRFVEENDKLYINRATDYNPYTKRFEAEYSLTRWFADIQDDFAARIAWMNSDEYSKVSHYPEVMSNQEEDVEVLAGQKVTLSVEAKDKNNFNLNYHWWCYFEASTYWKTQNLEFTIDEVNEYEDMIWKKSYHSKKMECPYNLYLENTSTNKVSFIIPDDAKSGDTFHIILEVTNDCNRPMKTYKRFILTVK